MKARRRRGRALAAGAAALCLLCAGAVPRGRALAQQTDAQALREAAWSAFLDGDLDGPREYFQRLAGAGGADADADADLALLARDLGRHDEARDLWAKAAQGPQAGGFVWNQRGWALAALHRLPQAKESFLKAVDRSSTTADQAEAKLGLGLVTGMGPDPAKALAPLRAMLTISPYAMATASQETAKASLSAGDQRGAAAYLRQCISLDPLDLECLKELALLHARMGEDRAAWYHALRVLAFEPGDPEAARQAQKLARAGAQAVLPARRLSRMLLSPESSEAQPPALSPSIRVALLADADGRPAAVSRFNFVVNSDFAVKASSGGAVRLDAQGGRQWEVSFRPETGLVDLRDASGSIKLTARESLRLVPGGARGSILLRNLAGADRPGVDAGDRELRGQVEILPGPGGLKLVNELGLEEYLYGVVSLTLPHGSPDEAFKAEAVVSRTRALRARARRPDAPGAADVCDSSVCQRYAGLSEEMREAYDAVRATAGVALLREGSPAAVLEHEDCGGVTAAGEGPEEDALVSVSDGPRPASPLRTPADLERWTHEYPPAGTFCGADSVTSPAQARWIRVIPAADIARRAGRLRDLGQIRHLRAAERSASGRVRALTVVGSKGSLTVKGDKAVADILSPGSLRSTLFTIQPLMDGGKADRFILWGAGTGHGKGFCRAGAVGLAGLGRGWQEILAHYFPGLRLGAAAPAPAAAGAGPR